MTLYPYRKNYSYGKTNIAITLYINESYHYYPYYTTLIIGVPVISLRVR